MSRREKFTRRAVVLMIVLAGILAGVGVEVNDDALDLLPDGAVRGDLQLLQEMGLVDRIFLTLRAEETHFSDPDGARTALQKSAQKLGELLGQSRLFTQVTARLPGGLEKEFFTRIWPLFPLLIDSEDLALVETELDEERIRTRLMDAYMRLNSFEGLAVKQQIRNDPLGFLPIFLKKLVHLQPEFHVVPDDGFLMSGDGRSLLILARSSLPLTESAASSRVLEELEAMYLQALQPNIQVEMIGTLPHTLANSDTIKSDLKILLPVASLLLVVLLAVTLRDIRALIVFATPFLGALPAIALTSVIFDEISALALGFGIVILGIAVDFSVHLFLALSRDEGSAREILIRLRKPVGFACLTTTSVLAVLFFSDVASHRQMATLALFGVLFGVFFAWLLIPTVVEPGQAGGRPLHEKGMLELPKQRGWQGLMSLSWILLLVLGIWSWPHLRYNGDLRVLDAPDERVIEMERHFSETWGSKGEQAFVVNSGATRDEALAGAGALFRFLESNSFSPVQSPVPLLPDTDTRLKREAAWQHLWSTYRPGFDTAFWEAATELGFSRQAFDPFFRWLDAGPGIISPEVYDDTLFAPMLESMLGFVPARDTGSTGRHLVLTTVGVDETNIQTLLEFGSARKDISVLANSKWRGEVESLLKKDILWLSSVAALLVAFLVSVQFRSVFAVAGVLAPVLSALAAMALFCRLTGSDLNMMHLIMGIMVIGLSVDYGIFIVCSAREEIPTSTGYAVSVCAASSLIGFGVLAFGSHPALSSLGTTVLVGIGAAWPTALLVSPAISGIRRQKEGTH